MNKINSFNKEKTGYLICISEDSNNYINNAKHIEKDDSYNRFKTDKEAREQASKDGMVFISNMKLIPDNIYIKSNTNIELINVYRIKLLREIIEKIDMSNMLDLFYLKPNELLGKCYNVMHKNLILIYISELFNRKDELKSSFKEVLLLRLNSDLQKFYLGIE